MAFSKKTFTDGQTVIDADTLNAIQDELIRVAGLLGKDIQSAAINDSGHLILTLTDGTTLDAGVAKGDPGTDGNTPIKGTDYWTVADKQEIVNSVIAALPDGTEVSY
jgi:hypothetical protein